MTAPLVTVILPTRNRAHVLRRAIDSVLAQTHRELELIVVDDGSTDATAATLAGVADPRLRVLHRERGGGAAAARNAGLALARGDFVAFLDDDDFWLVQKLEKQLAAFARAGFAAGWCISAYLRLERQLIYVGGPRYEADLDYSRGIGPGGPDWSLIATPGWMVRREVLAGLGGFDERIHSWDDWELGLRLGQATRRLMVDEPLWIQDRIDGGGLVKLERARAADMRVIMAKHGALWRRRRRVAARHWRVIGRGESLYDPAPAGRDALMQSLRLWPFGLKTWLSLAVTYLGQRRVERLTRQIRDLKARRT